MTEKMKLQCQWCNRFFTSQRGVERHKTYCAWHPKRLKALREERQKRRIKKANSGKYFKKIDEQLEKSEPNDFFVPNHFNQPHWNLLHPVGRPSCGVTDSRLMSNESDEYISGLPEVARATEYSLLSHNCTELNPVFTDSNIFSEKSISPIRLSVIKSTVLNCKCGCSYMNIHENTRKFSYPNSVNSSSPTSPISSTSSPSFSYPEEEDVDVVSF